MAFLRSSKHSVSKKSIVVRPIRADPDRFLSSLVNAQPSSSACWPTRNGNDPGTFPGEASSIGSKRSSGLSVAGEEWSSGSDHSTEVRPVPAFVGSFPSPPPKPKVDLQRFEENQEIMRDRPNVSLADPNQIGDVPPLAITAEEEQSGVKGKKTRSSTPVETYRPVVDRASHPVPSDAGTPTIEELELEPAGSVLGVRKDREEDEAVGKAAAPRQRRSVDVSNLVSAAGAAGRYPPTSAERSTATSSGRSIAAPHSSPASFATLPAILRPPALPTSKASPPFPTALSIVEAGPSRFRDSEPGYLSPALSLRPPSPRSTSTTSLGKAPAHSLERYSLSSSAGQQARPRVSLPPPAALLAPLRRPGSSHSTEGQTYLPPRSSFNHEHSHGYLPEPPLASPTRVFYYERPRSPPWQSRDRYSLSSHGAPVARPAPQTSWEASPPRRIEPRLSAPQLYRYDGHDSAHHQPPPQALPRRYTAAPVPGPDPRYHEHDHGSRPSGMTGYEVRREYAFGGAEEHPSQGPEYFPRDVNSGVHRPTGRDPEASPPGLQGQGRLRSPSGPTTVNTGSGGAGGHRVESRTKAGLIGLSRTVQGRTYREYP